MLFTVISIKWYRLLGLFERLGFTLDIPDAAFLAAKSKRYQNYRSLFRHRTSLQEWLADDSALQTTRKECQSTMERSEQGQDDDSEKSGKE